MIRRFLSTFLVAYSPLEKGELIVIEIISEGGITSAVGFTAGSTYAGLKTEAGVPDLGIVLSDRPDPHKCDRNPVWRRPLSGASV